MTDTFSPCVINLGPTMLVTGGGHNASFTRVIEYSETGYVRDWPRLNEARYYHGCSYFTNDQGTRVHTTHSVVDIEPGHQTGLCFRLSL